MMTFFLIASHLVPQHQLDRMRLQIDLVGQIRHPAAPDVMGEQVYLQPHPVELMLRNHV